MWRTCNLLTLFKVIVKLLLLLLLLLKSMHRSRMKTRRLKQVRDEDFDWRGMTRGIGKKLTDWKSLIWPSNRTTFQSNCGFILTLSKVNFPLCIKSPEHETSVHAYQNYLMGLINLSGINSFFTGVNYVWWSKLSKLYIFTWSALQSHSWFFMD